jgi:hypothetical protein
LIRLARAVIVLLSKPASDLAFDFSVLFIHGWLTGDWDGPKDEKAESGFHRTPLENPNRLIATTSAAAAIFAVATAAAWGAFFTRLGNIDGEGASAHILAVQGISRLLRLLVRAHGHESKAAGTIGHAIHYQGGFADRAVRGEGVSQVIFSGVEGKIPDE